MSFIHHLHPHLPFKGNVQAVLHLKATQVIDSCVSLRDEMFVCHTFEEKSGGRVLDPVSLLIRNVLQLLNL